MVRGYGPTFTPSLSDVPGVHHDDDDFLTLGNSDDVQIGYSTQDANANALIVELPAADGVNVPAAIFGIGHRTTDLGMFNGITQPVVAAVDVDLDSYLGLSFSGDDVAVLRMRLGAGGTLREHVVPDVASSTFAVLGAAQTWTAQQLIQVDGIPLILERTTDAAAQTAFSIRGNNRAAAQDEDNAYISLYLQNDAATPENVEAIRLLWQLRDVSDGSEDGYLAVQGMRAGNIATLFEVGWLADASGRAIWNTAQHDFDFVLHGDTNTYALEYNAGLFTARGAFGFGAQAATSAFLNVIPPAFTAAAGADIAALRVAPAGITVPAGVTAIAASVEIVEPVLTATGTITEAASLHIRSAPTEGSVANYALLVTTGLARLGGNLALGTGEGGTTAPTGTTLRAPNATIGGAGNVAGADLTIAAGLGTGTGDAGTLILQLPIVAAAGDNIQTLATRLTLDMAGSQTVLTMLAAQAMTITTSAGDLTLNPAGDVLLANTVNLLPATTNGSQLGSATLMFADLFLASGAVVNFDNGNVLMTHSAAKVALSGTTTSFVVSTVGGVGFGISNPTVPGVFSAGSATTISLLDNQSITITIVNAGVVCISDSRGNQGVFAYEYASATVTELSDPSAGYDVTDVDNAKIAVFTPVNSYVLTIKNYTNATRTITVYCAGGYVSAATAPA